MEILSVNALGLCLTAAAAAILTLAASFVRKRKVAATLHGSSSLKAPPMIASLPVVGSLPFLPSYSQLHAFFLIKSQTMGGIIGCYLGSRFTVVLNGTDAIREALIKNASDFATRPKSFSKTNYLNTGYKGIGDHMYDDHFKRYHQLYLSILKEFGFGQGVMEVRILQEVSSLVDNIRAQRGAAFCPDHIVTCSVFNVIASILFDRRYHYTDPDLVRFIELQHLYTSEYYDFMPVDSFNVLRFLPHYGRVLRSNLTHKRELFHLIDKTVVLSLAERSRKGGDSFIASLLDKEGPELDYKQFKYGIRSLILGGTETSATALLWFLVYMANHAEVQRRAQEEIDAVVPRGSLPSLEDEKRLPYVQATVLELMRRRTMAPLAVPHAAQADSTIGGYFVPADSYVIVNLYSAHMDPRVWGDPETFRPERFLDSAGEVTGRERVISFSMGKRSCIGEQLARQEMFLFFTSLLQQFHIRPPGGQEKVVCGENIFLISSPTPFEIEMLPR